MARIANKIKKAKLAKQAVRPNTNAWQRLLLSPVTSNFVASKSNLTEDIKTLIAAIVLILTAAIVSFIMFVH